MACQECTRVYCREECSGSKGSYHYQDKQRKVRRSTIIQKRIGQYSGIYGHIMLGCSQCGSPSKGDLCENCKI